MSKSLSAQIWLFIFGIFGIFGVLSIPKPITAQVVPDNTLPSNSEVETRGDTNIIEGGTSSGNNLFHSFDSVSVPTGGTAYFNNAQGIQNIFSRVTGSSISNIDGLIKANGNANLFLLNPNGILFGPNASLNLGGSFFATSASSIKFADGVEFSATNPQANSALTVSVPVGLGFASNPGAITVQGAGNNLSADPQTLETIRDDRPVGLQVNRGKTLSLVGGDIFLEGGNLTAEEGRIELGSIGENETVNFTQNNSGWKLNYENVMNFQDIRLSNAASVDASGNGAGDIQVQGRQISLSNSSVILANTLGNGNGGNITVKASQNIQTGGASNFFSSGIYTDVASGATGKGGNLMIETGGLQINYSSQIVSRTFGSGDAGELKVTAQDIEAIGKSGLFTINAQKDSTGRGGNLTIKSDRLKLADGAQIASSTFGAGDAGELNVTVQDIEVIGEGASSTSTLSTSAQKGSTGRGGNLTIKSDRLKLADGAVISSGTFGSGDAGELNVTAQDIEVIGEGASSPSGLLANAPKGSTGRGGNLTIKSDHLKLVDGAQIASSTFGAGDAGELNVTAQDIEAIGEGEFPSGLFASAQEGSSGQGGNLTIKSDRLRVADGAEIFSGTFGAGDAGELNVTAQDIEVIGKSGFFADAKEGSSGQGGNLTIKSDQVRVTDGAKISSRSRGSGQAGNIDISANQIESDQGSITATSDQSGGGDINLKTGQLFLSNNSSINTSVFDGTGGGGNLTIDTDTLVALDNSDLTANAIQGVGGNIDISAEGVFRSLDSDIDASSQLGIDGEVNINSIITDFQNVLNPISPKFIVAEEALQGSCFVRRNSRQGSFVYGGAGGLPVSPSSAIDEESSLSSQLPEVQPNLQTSGSSDLGSEDSSAAGETVVYPVQTAQKWQVGEPIIEPTNLIKTADGRLLWVRKQVDDASSLICQ
jgi:filamentous hemagglutinin family protein